jgi:uncharacterized membrane protein
VIVLFSFLKVLPTFVVSIVFCLLSFHVLETSDNYTVAWWYAFCGGVMAFLTAIVGHYGMQEYVEATKCRSNLD